MIGKYESLKEWYYCFIKCDKTAMEKVTVREHQERMRISKKHVYLEDEEIANDTVPVIKIDGVKVLSVGNKKENGVILLCELDSTLKRLRINWVESNKQMSL